jgi:hypothetical protein
MFNLENYISLSDLEKRWSKRGIDFKKLVQFVYEGRLEVKVICPDIFTSYWPGLNAEPQENIVPDSWEYHAVDASVIREAIGFGHTFIRSGTWIEPNGKQIRTLRQTEFVDLMVSLAEVSRFEAAEFKTEDTQDGAKKKLSNKSGIKSPTVRSAQKNNTLQRDERIREVATQVLESDENERFRWETGNRPHKKKLATYIYKHRHKFQQLAGQTVTERVVEKALGMLPKT